MHNQSLNIKLVILIASVLCLIQTGCLLVAAGAAAGTGVAYVRGDLEASLNADPQAVADATEAAMKDLDLAIVSKQASKLDGQVIGRTATDKRLKVDIQSESEHVSKVSIRAGFFGNSAMQANMLEKIKSHLPG